MTDGDTIMNPEMKRNLKLYRQLKGTTYSSVKLSKVEMLEGMGPSKPLAWISLLTPNLKRIQVSFENLCCIQYYLT